MKCCDGNNKNEGSGQEHKHKSHFSHMWMMLLCCGAPVMLLIMLPLISSLNPGIRNPLASIIPFICPVMMVMMIPMMLKGNKSNGENKECCEQKQIGDKN